MNYHVEKVALQVWEKFNPMYDMEKSEKPDWVDIKRKVGLEVVIAKSEKACKQENFAERNLGKDISTISNDSINEMEHSGIFFATGQKDADKKVGMVKGAVRIFDAKEHEVIYSVIKNKLQKSGYQKLDRVDLFVLARQFCIETFGTEDWDRLFNCEKECGSTIQNHYDKIYLDFYPRVVVFDMHLRNYKILEYQT